MSYSQKINRYITHKRLRANTPADGRTAVSRKAYANTIRNLLESRVHRAYTMTMDELFLRGYLSRDERLEISRRIGDFLGELGTAVDEDGADGASVGGRVVDAEDVEAIAKQKGIGGAANPKRLRAVSPESFFSAFKGGDGRYRWVMISSNSYQDRDGEWVTQKAQAADVERMNRTGRFGTLDWWHTKIKATDGRLIPLDIGDCDQAIMLGRFRLESGTFRDETVGASFAASKERMGGSLEFLYPANEPAGGQFHHVFTIRRSVLPADAASNSLTGLVIGQKEQVDMSKKTYERLKALAAQNGVDAVLQAIAGVADMDERAKGLGLAAKSAGAARGGGVITNPLADLSDTDLDALVADIVALKEQREAQPETVALEAVAELDVDALAEAMTKAFRTVVTEQTDTLTALLTDRTKEQVEADRKASELEAKIKEMSDELAELQAGPRATKEQGGAGRAINGYRPTQRNQAVTPTAQKARAGGPDYSAIQDAVAFLNGEGE